MKKEIENDSKVLARAKLLIKLGKLLADMGQINSSVLDTLSLESLFDNQVEMTGVWTRL